MSRPIGAVATRLRAASPVLLVLHAVAVAAWWVSLRHPPFPGWRAAFFPAGWSEALVRSFLVPDLLLLVGGSLAAAHGLRRAPERWGPLLLALVLGANAYATLMCWCTLWSTGEAPLAVVAMSLSTLGLSALLNVRWPRA